jgi:asparagine synthase (glutamine-hydrolysing)
MCGIAGLIRWDDPAPTSHEVHAMCDAMIHRGPDDEGLFVGDGAAIGMRRLSIIDLATGHQPVHNEDESLWVVFNGEIYNYQELRAELESRGHRFYTTSDTETIVHLYEDFGAAAVDKLRGMFAFAILGPPAAGAVHRPRSGRHQAALLCGDSRRPGLCLGAESAAGAAGDFPPARLAGGGAPVHVPVDAGHHSILRGVKKLDAGHRLIAKGPGTPAIDRYWDVEFNPRPRTEGECVEELRALLEEAVTLHMRSDVPVGAFLSGGLDSSAIVSLMSRMTPRRVKTFSIGFHEAAFDELRYARQIAHAFGTDHHELVLAPQALDIVEDLTWALDEPFGDSSAIPTYMVSQLAAEHVKVVLSGDGGDELFGGYDKYVVEARERRYERVPSVVRARGGGHRPRPPGRNARQAVHEALRARRRGPLSGRHLAVRARRSRAALRAGCLRRGARRRPVS